MSGDLACLLLGHRWRGVMDVAYCWEAPRVIYRCVRCGHHRGPE